MMLAVTMWVIKIGDVKDMILLFIAVLHAMYEQTCTSMLKTWILMNVMSIERLST
jgi:hypothetical protein